ncbi:MAG: hypothetical protein COV91_06270 [Candidatus Taylorbacteria bacterium CG11_big_fil_rev_8_21_14_0_20_46_11]|uniref:Transposase Synechocystis PCC 6803 domain-containing protein n=1 Tax=Candidatus Taylorbacteria bacterium CG11_big_fil_rev_8_21_14_0_20_46_11 TaxID=1975025 RepID=A0A2H0K9U8_9BACT|nr:MAG: hypothetical protein COV91_06270 [Candidatus Taylorbacteria bacterium CG11_big_fil_rev_8_21_14_0_20_46_11]
MKHIREKALELRTVGYSYNEISKNIGVAKSTLYSWLHDVVLSQRALERLKSRVAQGTLNGLVKRNKMQTVLARERARTIKEKASSEIPKITYSELLLIGAALYWAEGYKRLKMVRGREVTGHVVSLTNSDPSMVMAFILFLKQVLTIPSEKIFISMRLFTHSDEEKSVLYWMKATGLKRTQFTKPTYPVSRSSQGKRPFNRLPYGTVQVIVSDTQVFYRIIGFIEGVKDQLRVNIK